MIARPFVIGMLALVLSGCASLIPETPSTTFDLTAPREVKTSAKARFQISVSEPSALQILDSERIVIRPVDGSLSYLSGAQWADRLPKLLQRRLVQTFENARRLSSVGTPEDKLAPGVSLSSEIRAFEINAASASAVIEISVKLIDERSGRIGAAEIFRSEAPASAITGPEAAAALDNALQDTLRQIVAWTTARV